MTSHLVVPGQVIAEGGAFLPGHGTYVEKVNNTKCLLASVCGHVQCVNKLPYA
jgi:exosome complex RNA-binding protein Rrp4